MVTETPEESSLTPSAIPNEGTPTPNDTPAPAVPPVVEAAPQAPEPAAALPPTVPPIDKSYRPPAPDPDVGGPTGYVCYFPPAGIGGAKCKPAKADALDLFGMRAKKPRRGR